MSTYSSQDVYSHRPRWRGGTGPGSVSATADNTAEPIRISKSERLPGTHVLLRDVANV